MQMMKKKKSKVHMVKAKRRIGLEMMNLILARTSVEDGSTVGRITLIVEAVRASEAQL